MHTFKITAVSEQGTETHTVHTAYDAALTATKLEIAGASVTVTEEPDPIQSALDKCRAKLDAR